MPASDEEDNASDHDQDENAPPKDSDAELEAAIAAIRGNKDLPRPPYPTLPNMNGAQNVFHYSRTPADAFATC